jgi:hypothetical protein
MVKHILALCTVLYVISIDALLPVKPIPTSSSFSPSKYLATEPTWRIFKKPPKTTVVDILSALGRFSSRTDFYTGQGYERPSEGLLNKDMFYERLSKRKFEAKNWPVDANGIKLGCENLSMQEISELTKFLQASEVSRAGCDAIFTTFAKGATNGIAYPEQVDEEMQRWLNDSRVFQLRSFETNILLGKLAVFIGWFLYIGLQFGGVYVIFFAPIASYFFPDIDFYPVQTFLHTSEWGK